MRMPKLYVEDLSHEMPRKFLSDNVYSKAIAAFVIVCTDTVIVDSKQRTLFLAKRAVKPMLGLWVIGSRRIAGETPEDSVRRCFKKETSLDIDKTRFVFATIVECFWKDREQEPQNVGCDDLNYWFTLELTPDERERTSASLDRAEYEKGFGLQEYNRERLVREKAHPALTDLYDLVFPS